MGEIVDFFQSSPQPDQEVISVLLVDDQPVFRNVARSVLERDGACEIIGEATDGAHAIDLMNKLNPDIVVMDVQMGDMSGVDASFLDTHRPTSFSQAWVPIPNTRHSHERSVPEDSFPSVI